MKNNKNPVVFVVLLGLIVLYGTYNRYAVNQLDNVIMKVSEKYGESNPRLISQTKDTTEGFFEPMYLVHLIGNFSYKGVKANNLYFSILSDGSKVWAIRLTDINNNVIWVDDESFNFLYISIHGCNIKKLQKPLINCDCDFFNLKYVYI